MPSSAACPFLLAQAFWNSFALPRMQVRALPNPPCHLLHLDLCWSTLLATSTGAWLLKPALMLTPARPANSPSATSVQLS